MNRPWEPLGMTTADWLRIPPIMLPIFALSPTNAVRAGLLAGPDTSYCGDLLPHIVCWKGNLYINDGNHRIARRIRSGMRWVIARLVNA